MDQDLIYMSRALELAKLGEGHTNPNPMVGAVLVKNGRIIGEGYHEVCGQAHAEVNAFKHATEDPEGADLYVTLEPCSHYGKTPPCAKLIIEKKVRRVIIAALDPNPLVSGRGVRMIQEAGIEVISGVMEEEAKALNEVFMRYIVNKQPYLVLKYAMTLDGKIATAAGDAKWITSEDARAHARHMRGVYMGILAGIGTVLADDPQLTAREEGARNPIRIIVDSSLRIPENARVLDDQESAKTIIAVATPSDQDKRKRLEDREIKILDVPGEDGRVDLVKLMTLLGEMGIDSVLVEGGGQIIGSLVKAHLADRVLCYISPKLVGGDQAKTPAGGDGIAVLADAMKLDEIEVANIGPDVLLSGKVVKMCSQES